MKNLSTTQCQGTDAVGAIVKGHCVAYHECIADFTYVNGQWMTPQQVQTAGLNGAAGSAPTEAPPVQQAPANPPPMNPPTTTPVPNPGSSGTIAIPPAPPNPPAAPANPGTGGQPTTGSSPAQPAPVTTTPPPATITGTPGSVFQPTSGTGVVQPTTGSAAGSTGLGYAPTGSTFSTKGSSQGTYTGSSFSSSLSSAGKTLATSFGVNLLLGFFSSLLSTPSYTPTAQASPAPTIVEVNPIVIENEPSPSLSSGQGLSSQEQSAELANLPKLPEEEASAQAQQQAPQPQSSSFFDFLNDLAPISSLFPTLVQASPPQNVPQTIVQVPPVSGENASASSTPPGETNIASLALYNITNLNGQWTYSPQHLKDEQSLAQAQSNLQWLQAQEQALEASDNAGVCDNNCVSDLATVEAQIPEAEQELAQDTATVNEPIPTSFANQEAQAAAEEDATGEVSPQQPVFSQTTSAGNPSSGIPLGLQELAPETISPAVLIPASEPSPQTSSGEYAAQEAQLNASQPPAPPPPPSPAEQFISNVVQTVENWFSPASTSTVDRSQSCSLIASLFGGCSGW